MNATKTFVLMCNTGPSWGMFWDGAHWTRLANAKRYLGKQDAEDATEDLVPPSVCDVVAIDPCNIDVTAEEESR